MTQKTSDGNKSDVSECLLKDASCAVAADAGGDPRYRCGTLQYTKMTLFSCSVG
jgi:hypothetical protein